ncbi:MAG: AMP-binding protein [Gammaproteobacteria bacterium]|nr:AMP-binding protein [Gammaproteobacteria bacterium]
MALEPTTCGGILRAAAAAWPDAVALIDADGPPGARRRWTYAELHAAAERTARALGARFAPGDHVAVWAANSPEWVILQFGLALAGLVMVTVNPASRVAELGYVLRQSRARGVFHQRHYRGLDMAAAIAETGVALDGVACLDDLAAFVATHDDGRALPDVDPHAPAMIQYTSGTTGKPKGALLNHFSVTNNARMMALIKELDPTTVNLAVAPLFHTGGCVGGVLGSVQTGGALLLPSSFDAESMLDLVAQERVTYTFAVPTMLIALLNAQAARPRDLSSLVTVFSGAATVPVEVVKRVEREFGARLIIGYGQTETSPAITHTRPDDAPVDKSETIGYALPQVEIKIVDPASGATLPVDTPGELCTRGFLVMMGYYDNPQATAATIDADGWLHTGDLCTMDARGYVRITGRLKDMIIRGGENIYPREIEEVLYTHPAIADVAVIGLPDDYWGESVGAVLMLRDGEAVTGSALEAFCGERLARHKVPRQWFVVDAIPTTTSGKLQKFRLAEMYRAGELEPARLVVSDTRG